AAALEKDVDSRRSSVTPALEGNRARGAELLRSARASLNSGRIGDAAALAEARKGALGAADLFRRVLRDLEELGRAESARRLETLIREATEAFTLLNIAVENYQERVEKYPAVVDLAMQEERRKIQAR